MTRDAFEERLELNPANWDLRLIYADYLDDLGEHILAYGQRWQAREEKFAYKMIYGDKSSVEYLFWNASHFPNPNHPESTIAENVFNGLCKKLSWLQACEHYETNAAADASLARSVYEIEVGYAAAV